MSAPFTEHTDAQLVAGVLAGDRDAFAAVYDRYADRLHDFCHSVLRDRDEAADAVQDTFVLVAQRLTQLNDPDRLRPWLYAVARSVALRRVRARRRVVLDEVEDMADSDPGPHRAAEQEALRDLVWSAAAGLSERDRALLDLHVRQGLDGAELGEAMGVSTSHAYVLLTRLRDQVERSLGALLIARLGRRDCAELDTVLAGWDGKFSPLMRKRVARHVDSCAVCGDRRKIMVSPFALLAAIPLVPAPLFLRDRVMDQVQLVAHTSTTTTTGTTTTAAVVTPVVEPEEPAAAATRSRRTRVLAAAAAVLLVLAGLGAVTYWRNAPVPGEPLGLDAPIGTIGSSAPPTTGGSATELSTTTPPTTTDETTTTTTEDEDEDEPPPPDPPDPPDPPADTTDPVIGGARSTESSLNVNDTVWCQPPYSSGIVASATDDVGVESMVLSWSGPDGSGSQPMSADGQQWYATLGPFTNGGDVSWTVTATDAAGNASASGGSLPVATCPIIG